MKSVILSVQYRDSDQQISYGCLCIGVQTRRNLYVNVQNSLNHSMFFKVKKKDTYAGDFSSIIELDSYRCMDVAGNVGFLDERFQDLEDDQMIRKIKKVVRYYRKEIKKLH